MSYDNSFLLLSIYNEYNFQPNTNDSYGVIYLHSLHVLLVFCCLSRLLISILGFNTRTLKYAARSII